MLRPVLLLAALMPLAAAELGPYPVQAVSDGTWLSLNAGTVLGGRPNLMKIHLVWIAGPPSRGDGQGKPMPEGKQALAALKDLAPAGVPVKLWFPGDKPERDSDGRSLVVATVDGGEGSLQEALVKAGWAVYWRKGGDAPEPWHAALLKAQEAAKQAKAGAWATAEKWMTDKAAERSGQR